MDKKTTVNALSVFAVSAWLSLSPAQAGDVEQLAGNFFNSCANYSGEYTKRTIRSRECLEAITDMNLAIYETLSFRQRFTILNGCDELLENPRSSNKSLLSENFNCALHIRDRVHEGVRDPDSWNGLILDTLFCMHGSAYKTEDDACEYLEQRNDLQHGLQL